MSLLVLLLRRSAGTVALAVLCGLISGASSAGLIARINEILASGGPLVDSRRVLGFAGIGMLMLGARIGSQLLLNRLQTRTTYELRARLSNRILATPLRRLEELGTHRLLATLVNDIQSLTQSLLCIPVILLNACIRWGSTRVEPSPRRSSPQGSASGWRC